MPPILTSLNRFSQSSIGRKIIVAVTGLLLAGFVIVHLIGNLLVFAGADAMNAYAKKLHDMGPLLWIPRLGLLALVGLHIIYTVALTRANRAARPQQYAVNVVQKASTGSRTMILSGLTILAFVIYHLAHFTVGVANDYYNPANARYWLNATDHNAYQMVVDGFRVWWVSLFYLVAMSMLFMHLGHGLASLAQTLGVSTTRAKSTIETLGKGLAALLFVGFASIPVAVLLGLVH